MVKKDVFYTKGSGTKRVKRVGCQLSASAAQRGRGGVRLNRNERDKGQNMAQRWLTGPWLAKGRGERGRDRGVNARSRWQSRSQEASSEVGGLSSLPQASGGIAPSDWSVERPGTARERRSCTADTIITGIHTYIPSRHLFSARLCGHEQLTLSLIFSPLFVHPLL
ncbi:hypothetical protein VTN02DRAFT_5305 [Thermoascus thermophilus]